jgi:hypothetical protein
MAEKAKPRAKAKPKVILNQTLVIESPETQSTFDKEELKIYSWRIKSMKIAMNESSLVNFINKCDPDVACIS